MPTISYESLTEWIGEGPDTLPAVCSGCEHGRGAHCHVCPLFGAEPVSGYAHGESHDEVDYDDIVNAHQHAAFCGATMYSLSSFECPVCGRTCLGVPDYILGDIRNAVRLCRECFHQLDSAYEVALNTYLQQLPHMNAQMREESRRNYPDGENEDHIFRTRTCDVCGEETTVGSSHLVNTPWGDHTIVCYECSRGPVREWINALIDARGGMENFLMRAHRQSSVRDVQEAATDDGIVNHCTCHTCGETVRECDGSFYDIAGTRAFVCDDCGLWSNRCAACDSLVPSWQITLMCGANLCPTCATNFFVCSECNRLRSRERMSECDGVCVLCADRVTERTLAAYYQTCAGALASEEMAYTDEPEWICHECETILSLDDDEQFDTPDGPMCEDCYVEDYFICARCDEVHHNDDGANVGTDDGDQTWCDDCAGNHSYRCDDCGNRIAEDMIHRDDSETTICDDCYEDHWTCCDECGCLVHHDDTCYDEHNEVDLCRDCYENRPREPDYDSSNRRDWIRGYEHTEARYFYDGGDDDADVDRTRSGRSGGEHARGKTLYLSPEVEFDGKHGDGDWDVIQEIMRAHSDELVITEDGSLDCGAEIKTEPRTLAAHYAFEWTDIMARMVRAGWRAHDVEYPGLHVHLSRAAFDDEAHVAKFVLMFHRLWDQLAKFSRRHEFGYCKRYDDIHDEDTVYDVYSKARNQNGNDRNLCVNLRRRDTVEVRLWKGTLNAGTFYATLELCHLLFHVSRETNITDLHTYTWAQLKGRANTYKHLPAYLERRGL